MNKILLCTCLFFFISEAIVAQRYSWSEDGNTDFFEESNWIDTLTGLNPAPGSIDPSQDINFDLYLNCEVEANGIIQLGAGSLFVENGVLTAPGISGGLVTIAEEGYVTLFDNIPLANNTQVDFIFPVCWLKVPEVNPVDIQNNYLNQFSCHQETVSYPESIRFDNYYASGTVIRPHDLTAAPLRVYDSDSLQGNHAAIAIDQIHSGDFIPNNLNNNVQSFLLKKGYMATLAVNENGTGKSRVFIAVENDLAVLALPEQLMNDISFIRVIPWNWVARKGTGGDVAGLDNSWYYRWNNNGLSDLEREYAPMSWGRGGADDQADIDLYKSKYKATHVMAFNEPDNCNDQSGQYGNMCIPDTAVMIYENLMKTGLRLVSPSCREGAWNGWLATFNTLAVQQNIRIDVIAVHWYDWGGNPVNTPNADPQNIFNRFKNYLNNVHDLYGLPIWITEFNGNKNRTYDVNLGFMELALPFLDTLSYVERYAWFEPNSGTGPYYDASGNYTTLGTFYKNQTSTPAIPESVWSGISNLDDAQSGVEQPLECITPSDITAVDESYTELKTDLEIFPNPATESISGNFSGKIDKIIVFDLNGKIVKEFSRLNDMDISDLPGGMYLIMVNQDYYKFIKI